MPETYTFHFEVKDILTMFLQALDGAIINRYDKDRNVGDVIGLRYVYGPKQRVLFDLVDKAQHITLPCCSYNITSIQRDNSRTFNNIDGHLWPDYVTGNAPLILQPVAVNIDVAVSIITRYQEDMDQIVTNFAPYTDPYLVVSWERYDLPGEEIRLEVLWSGNLAYNYPVELQATTPYRCIVDTGFTIKGWLFKADSDPVGRIFKINTTFTAVSAIDLDNLQYITDTLNGPENEYTNFFTISAIPQTAFVSRFETPESLSGSADLYGQMFTNVYSVYLSGGPGMFGNITTLSDFTSAATLSATYPALSGLSPVLSYFVWDDNHITVSYPAPSANGFFDIILVNEAGYSFMTQTVYNPNISPQFPYSEGIYVL